MKKELLSPFCELFVFCRRLEASVCSSRASTWAWWWWWCLLACFLPSPGSRIEPWRNCSCSSLSSAMDPWVVVVVVVEEEEEETELDLEFIFFFFFCFFSSVCECWAPRPWRLHPYCCCGEKLRKRKKESFGLCVCVCVCERERERERDNFMLLTTSFSMEDSRTACNGEWSEHGGFVLFLAPRLLSLWSTGDIGRRRRRRRRRRRPPCLPEFDEFRDDGMVVYLWHVR